MTQSKRYAIPGALALLLAAGSCGQHPNDGDTVEVTDNLGSSEVGCGTGTPEGTITGNGILQAGADYNPSACFRAFRVNVNNYAPGEMGTLVAYNGSIPTTSDECGRTSLRVYVWRRNADGTGTFLNNFIRRGTWGSDALGGMRCATPNTDLTTLLTPDQLPRGGNIRIAARASILPPTGSTAAEVFKEILFSIPTPVHARSAAQIVTATFNLGTTLANLGPTIHPDVQRLWNIRNAPGGVHGAVCRTWELTLSAMQANALSLKRILPAAQAPAVDVRTTSLQQIYTLICNSPNATTTSANLAALQTALRDHLLWGKNIETQLMTALGASELEASQLLTQSGNLDAQRVMTRCGGSRHEIENYIALGTRPAGMAGANPLLRNCTGSIGSIAGSAGIGVSTTTDPRSKYRACVDKQTALLTSTCAGPRSSEPAAGEPSTDPADPDGPCAQGKIWDVDRDKCFTEDELQAEDPDYLTSAEWTKAFVAAVDGYTESSRRATIVTRDSKIETAAGTVFLGAAGVGLVPLVVPGVVGIAGGLILDLKATSLKERAETYRHAICKLDPGNPQYCGSGNKCVQYDFLGDKAWAQSSPDPITPDGAQTTQLDRLDDCLCQLFDKDYGRLSGFEFGGPSPYCPDSHEALIEDCFRNPEVIGTTDARKPRPECMAILYPKELDRDAMLARYCHAAMPNCTGAYGDDQGACACPGGGGGLPSAPLPSCPNGPNATDCGPNGYLNEKNCHCVDFDSGVGCAKGGLSGYLARSPNDVYVATFPKEAAAIRNRNFLMFAPGNTPIATRKIQSAGLSTSMTQVKLLARVPVSTLASGFQGWAVQLSCTNEGNNVQNRSLGTAQLQALSPGANTLTYALTAADRTACFNGDKTAARFEIRSNNPVTQARLGFEDLSVTNLIDDLPNLPDPCSPPSNPSPDPIPITLPPLLTFDGLFGQRNWRFSEGTLVSLPVIR